MNTALRFKSYLLKALPLATDFRASTIIWESAEGDPLTLVSCPAGLCLGCLAEMLDDLAALARHQAQETGEPHTPREPPRFAPPPVANGHRPEPGP